MKMLAAMSADIFVEKRLMAVPWRDLGESRLSTQYVNLFFSTNSTRFRTDLDEISSLKFHSRSYHDSL